MSKPKLIKNYKSPSKSLLWGNKTINVYATNNPITNLEKRNEVFVDVVEKLLVLLGKNGNVLRKEI